MTHYHIYAIGNALVDSEYEVSDAQLQAMGVDKRHMTLIDTPRRAELLGHVQSVQPRRTGGGSAGNTVVALAQLGGQAYYSCQVADDELGDFYAQDLQHWGVHTNLTNSRAKAGQTGSCMVLVTPDAERSMCTFLGVSAELNSTALQPTAIAKSKIYYMEGYLAASPSGLQAAMDGREMAVAAGVPLALTLSDVSMIQFCRTGLDALLGKGVDYLFCNLEEAGLVRHAGLVPYSSTIARLGPNSLFDHGPARLRNFAIWPNDSRPRDGRQSRGHQWGR